MGYIDGFYDLAAENTAAERPDITFKRLKSDFPVHPMTGLHPLATLHFGGLPDWMALTTDSVWVTSSLPTLSYV